MSPLLHPSIDGDRVAQFRSILFPELIYLKNNLYKTTRYQRTGKEVGQALNN